MRSPWVIGTVRYRVMAEVRTKRRHLAFANRPGHKPRPAETAYQKSAGV